MIDFNFLEYSFDIQSNFLLVIGSVIMAGLFLGAIVFSIGSFIRFFIKIIQYK